MVTIFGDDIGHANINNAVWVAIFANNGFDIVELMWQSGFGGETHSPVH